VQGMPHAEGHVLRTDRCVGHHPLVDLSLSLSLKPVSLSSTLSLSPPTLSLSINHLSPHPSRSQPCLFLSTISVPPPSWFRSSATYRTTSTAAIAVEDSLDEPEDVAASCGNSDFNGDDDYDIHAVLLSVADFTHRDDHCTLVPALVVHALPPSLPCPAQPQRRGICCRAWRWSATSTWCCSPMTPRGKRACWGWSGAPATPKSLRSSSCFR
jgi:hypothetical protein